MALIPCRECGHPASTEAKTCPNCGAGKPTQRKAKLGRAGGCLITIIVVVIIGSLLPDAKPTPAAAPAQVAPTPPPPAAPPELTPAQRTAAAIQQRKDYAAVLDQGLLSQGLEVTVTTRGKDATTLWVKYALAGRAWSNNMGNAIMDRPDFQVCHFKKLVFEDAAETTHSFTIE